MAAARQAIPGKTIRFVVNSHAHFDHASGLGAAVAEGSTILTHRNNEQVLERLLAGSRTLMGDSLSKVTSRRKDVVQAVGDRDIRKGSNGKIVELHHAPNEHSDGMLVVYLPAEKLLWTADVSIVNSTPVQLATVKAVAATLDRLKLDYTVWRGSSRPRVVTARRVFRGALAFNTALTLFWLVSMATDSRSSSPSSRITLESVGSVLSGIACLLRPLGPRLVGPEVAGAALGGVRT